jgi:septum formation topological specificity factor MinE
LSRQAPTQGTIEERIVVVLEDRHRATPTELAQALRKPLAEVVEACGSLQGEERVRMDQHNGRPAYVLAVRH